MPDSERHRIAEQIIRSDRAFEDVVRRAGPPPARRNAPVDKRFASLVEAIVSLIETFVPQMHSVEVPPKA